MAKKRIEREARRVRRCLIVERHAWETGFAQEQLQIPLEAAEGFFGPAGASRPIRVRIAGAGPHDHRCTVSQRYTRSSTRRINGLHFVGLLGPCFVFFQETDDDDFYEFWCQYDVAIVAAHCGSQWRQARSSQHGRGRLVTIVDAPVPRPQRT